MKKVFAFLLSVVMVLSLVPLALFSLAASPKIVFDVKSYTDGVALVSMRFVDCVGMTTGDIFFSYESDQVTKITKEKGADAAKIDDIDNAFNCEFNQDCFPAEFGFYFKKNLWDSAKWAEAAEEVEQTETVNGENFECAVFYFTAAPDAVIKVTGIIRFGEESIDIDQDIVFNFSIEKRLGDVDFNGKIEPADARLILRAAVALEQFTDEQKELADVDFDGKITPADARLVLRASVGLEELSEKQRPNEPEEEDVGEIYYTETLPEHISSDENGIMYADNEVLVVAKDGVTKGEIEKLAEEYNAEIIGCIEITGDYQWKLKSTFNKTELDKTIERIKSNSLIKSASLNYIYETESNSVSSDINTGNDKEWKNGLKNSTDNKGVSWGVEAINAPEAWKIANDNKSQVNPVRVGVIDEYFDIMHDDIPYKRVFYHNNDIYQQLIKDYNNADKKTQKQLQHEFGHGTHVAGTFAADGSNDEGICGVYPYAKKGGLYVASFCNDELHPENTWVSLISNKVCLAELLLRNVKVINCSYGDTVSEVKAMYYRTILKDEMKANEIEHDLMENGNQIGFFLETFIEKGYDFIIVQAAGNESNKIHKLTGLEEDNRDVHYQVGDVSAQYISAFSTVSKMDHPDVYNRIIVVGSINELFERSSFSNCSDLNDRVDLYAPGENIYSTVPLDEYANGWSGTSMAAPHVAGVAALVWSINNTLSGPAIKSLLCQSLNDNHKDLPIIDAAKAVRIALKVKRQPVTPTPQNGAIYGFVVDGIKLTWDADEGIKDGAINNAEVIIKNAKTNEIVKTVKTGQFGHFEIILPEGEYFLSVSAEGYPTYEWPDIIKVEAGQVHYLRDWIKLQKEYSAEEIVDMYLSAYSVWSKDKRINLDVAEHQYQFLDLDFDGIPELVVSVGNIMRGDNVNNYYHLDFKNKKVVAYEVIDEEQGFKQSSLSSDVKLVYNDAAKRKEYRSSCQPWSRYHSYNIIKSISLNDGKVYDRSIYADGTEVDENYENPKQIYLRFDSNFESVSLTKEEYEQLVQADEFACKDLHLENTRINGKYFDAKPTDEKRTELLAALRSFSYDGFVPGYIDSVTAEEKESESVFLVPTEEDFAEMETQSHIGSPMLHILDMTMIHFDKDNFHHAIIDFNPETADSIDVLFYIFVCQLYDYYFGAPEEVSFSENEDPFFNPHGHTYYKYSVEKLNWIAKNALNLGEVDMMSLTAENEYGERRGECKEDCFYAYCFPFGIESGFISTVKNKERLADGSYRFTIGYEYFDMVETKNVSGEGTLIAGLKEVDEKRVWSVMNYQADLNIL